MKTNNIYIQVPMTWYDSVELSKMKIEGKIHFGLRWL